jgi:hypothetical protein
VWIHEDTIPPLRRLQFQFTLNNGGDDVQFVKLVLEYWQLPDPNSETREADQIIISPRSTGITLWRGKNVPNKVALVTKGDEDLIEEGLIELVSNTSSQIRLYWTGVELRLYGTMINLSQVCVAARRIKSDADHATVRISADRSAGMIHPHDPQRELCNHFQ